MNFSCPTCGENHAGPSFCFGAQHPEYYFSVPPEEREQRIQSTNDVCVVDGAHFFIRGRLEIPIIGHQEPFCWNVWTTLSEQNFERVNNLWNTVGRETEPPYFGWLQTRIPGYNNTLHITTLVHTRVVGSIPFIEVTEENHSLTLDQQDGISLTRALSVAASIYHGNV